MEAKRLAVVKKYMGLRNSGDKGTELVKLYASDGVLVDKDKKEHKGKEAMLKYYGQSQPAPSSVDDPQVQKDGSITIDFRVYVPKFRATYEFVENSELLKRVTVACTAWF